jgi:hypothetical protein
MDHLKVNKFCVSLVLFVHVILRLPNASVHCTLCTFSVVYLEVPVLNRNVSDKKKDAQVLWVSVISRFYCVKNIGEGTDWGLRDSLKGIVVPNDMNPTIHQLSKQKIPMNASGHPLDSGSSYQAVKSCSQSLLASSSVYRGEWTMDRYTSRASRSLAGWLVGWSAITWSREGW